MTSHDHTTVGLRELRRDASELVRRVQGGEEIDITVSGRLAARLVPPVPRRWQRRDEITGLFADRPDPDWRTDRDLIGTLNAFAAQSGWTNNYVVLSNELFANLRNDNREGTRFILGHEIAHIRLHHVALWYNLMLCYSQLIPILGPTLSRLREYSCDRNGAALEPKGELGLILLTAGRYAANNVQASELVDQGRHLGGFWVGISQLPRSHPWTVRRIWRLHQLGLFGAANPVGQ